SRSARQRERHACSKASSACFSDLAHLPEGVSVNCFECRSGSGSLNTTLRPCISNAIIAASAASNDAKPVAPSLRITGFISVSDLLTETLVSFAYAIAYLLNRTGKVRALSWIYQRNQWPNLSLWCGKSLQKH